MDYFTYNTVIEGCKRIRAEVAARRDAFGNRSSNYGALFATAREVQARRLEGQRLHRRGMSNEAAWHLYPQCADSFGPSGLSPGPLAVLARFPFTPTSRLGRTAVAHSSRVRSIGPN
jgi:hypothetical protein